MQFCAFEGAVEEGSLRDLTVLPYCTSLWSFGGFVISLPSPLIHTPPATVRSVPATRCKPTTPPVASLPVFNLALA